MTEATVSFVDLAGFVALTEAHGATAAADLATHFAQLAAEAARPPTKVVKTIGDAVLLSSPEPAAGLTATISLISACLNEPGFPLARGGIDTGEVAERDGDLFGSAVNLAARLTGYAAGQRLLLTDRLVPTAQHAGYLVEPIGPVKLRNVAQAVPVYAIAVDGPAQPPIDPVCRMRLEPGGTAGRLRHRGVDYWFCSRECIAAFATNPDGYLPIG